MSAPEFLGTHFPIRLYLVRSPREWRAHIKRWRKDWAYPNHTACIVQITPGVYTLVCGAKFRKEPMERKAGILAHEATHVLQHVKEYVAEGTGGWESDAYFVEGIVDWAWKIVVDGAVS